MTRLAWIALVVLLLPSSAAAQDPAAPVRDSLPPVDSATMRRDSSAATRAAEIERARQDSILYGKAPVTPMGALWRSILVPGWGQAKLNRKLTGALFVTWEGVTLGMSLKTSHELRYLRRTGSSSVSAKEQERQDWLVLLAFNHLFSAIEGYVSAHLWDFPQDLQVRAMPVPGGIGGSVSVPFRFP
jgi:hypothetical protein